jgi:hypothetical protein
MQHADERHTAFPELLVAGLVPVSPHAPLPLPVYGMTRLGLRKLVVLQLVFIIRLRVAVLP